MRVNIERTANPVWYRLLHWPIWIWVFFILPGHLTQALFHHGGDRRHLAWLTSVILATGVRGLKGRLPGVEGRPYVTHFGEDKPNLGYRVVCYTAAWIDLLVPYTINAVGLGIAAASGRWLLPELWGWLYLPLALLVVCLAWADRVPRARRSTWNEGAERAWFYGALWTVLPTQLVGWGAWRLANALAVDGIALARWRLGCFIATSLLFGVAAWRGKLPRAAPYRAAGPQTAQPELCAASAR